MRMILNPVVGQYGYDGQRITHIAAPSMASNDHQRNGVSDLVAVSLVQQPPRILRSAQTRLAATSSPNSIMRQTSSSSMRSGRRLERSVPWGTAHAHGNVLQPAFWRGPLDVVVNLGLRERDAVLGTRVLVRSRLGRRCRFGHSRSGLP